MPSLLADGMAGFGDMGKKFGQLLECPREIWIIFGMKFLESMAYFSTSFILVKFLSEEIGMSDQDAGWIYGGFGMMISIVGLCIGFVVDNLGVRASLVVASMILMAARCGVLFAATPLQITVVFMTIYPVGCALNIPVQMMSLKRYTTENTRQFAFSVFYVFMNISAAMAAFLMNGYRNLVADGATIAGMHLSMYRMILCTTVVFTSIMLVLSTTVREIRASDTGSVEEYRPRQANAWDIVKEVLGEPKFWRFFAIVVLFVGVRSNFMHMDATFPKYYTREFGADQAYELLLAINPVLIIFLVPVVTYVVNHFSVGFGPVLVTGGLISGFSPIILAISNTKAASVVWLCVLSLGEAIWSPKLMELSVAIAPEGREGTYMALAGAPLFISKLGVGGLSGTLLSLYCPETGPRQSQMMWFLITCSTAVPTILLALTSRCIFVPTDWQKEERAPLLKEP